MKKPNGYVIYRGPSLIDGAPIVVIAVMKSSNAKTGDIVQTFIMREDIAPHLAQKSGDDRSVCGECIHRPENMGSCYVTTFQGPLSVWKAYHRGNYSTDLGAFFQAIRGRKVRAGAYGDPTAAPIDIWENIAKRAQAMTGYTHQRETDSWYNPALYAHAMASADTESEARHFHKIGVRYFRVQKPGENALAREVECLADSRGLTCAECMVCDGGKKGKSITIQVHGAKASKFAPELIAVG